MPRLDLILEKIMVIGITENVKMVGQNNAIHPFDTCGISIFIQIHFSTLSCYIKENSVLLSPKTDISYHS